MSIVERIKSEYVFLTSAVRTLRSLKGILNSPERTFADVIEDFAKKQPRRIAIYDGDRKITYREYNQRANQVARWARAQGVDRGVNVAIVMENRAEYLIAWLGIIKARGAAALINTSIRGKELAHCLNISGADHVILGAELAENYASAVDKLERPMTVWAAGGQVQGANDFDQAVEAEDNKALPADFREGLTTEDRALYIYTSGTTGSPKAANISHLRLQGMMSGFRCAANAGPNDRMLVVLPLYHSAGGVCAVGSTLTAGGSVILKRKFSASEFWNDAVKYKATMFQYIGELCRYMLNAPENPNEHKHHIRIAMGNGLRPDIWPEFQKRFGIPRIVEFYGATEGNVAMMNFDGKVGAVGRIPGYAKRSLNVELVKFDIEHEMPVRDEEGFCIRCAPGEVGEAIGEISDDPSKPTSRFEGYATKEETEKKILRDVFTKGDQWFRTGDLLKQDEMGYFYFIDRIGDTFRWKGENVATSEVAEAISVFPGILEADVYGVAVPGTDGRAGMAALVPDEGLDMPGLYAHLEHSLPVYSQPLFLRLQQDLTVTGTFKHRKVDLVRDGFDPGTVTDPLYFRDDQARTFVPLDDGLHQRIVAGEVRV